MFAASIYSSAEWRYLLTPMRVSMGAMRRPLLSLVLLCGLAAPLYAASEALLAACEKDDSPPDAIIAACTPIAEDRQEDPEVSTDAYFNRGLAYSRKGDRDRAMADYSEAIRLNPKNKMAIYNRGSGHLAKRDYDRAIADSSAGIRLDPTVPYGYGTRAVAHHAKSNLDAALADYEAALQRDPKSPYALYGRGLIRRNKGNAAAGEADIAAAEAINAAAAEFFAAHGLK